MTAAKARGSVGKLSSETGLRFHQVLDDHLDPTIKARDYVLLVPVNRYTGEGYYLLVDHFGLPQSYCCSVVGTRQNPKIQLHCHNKHYRAESITLAQFEEQVLGKIAMICNVVDRRLLPDVEFARRCQA